MAVKRCGKSCNKFKWFTVWGLPPSIPIFKVNMVKHQPCDDQNVNPNSKWFDQVPFYHVSRAYGYKPPQQYYATLGLNKTHKQSHANWIRLGIKLTQLCNPTAYLNLPPTSFFRPCAKVLFFQYPENFSGPTLKFRTWPFWGINGNGNHWVQTCETNIWWIFKPLALIHANKSTPSPNSWQGRIRI